MPTREQVYSIEARINPLVQMIYVKPPYTAHLDDARLLSADSAQATQKTLAREEALHAAMRQRSPFLQETPMPEQSTGHLVGLKS